MQNLVDELTALLAGDDRLVSEGKLLKNKIMELALGLDPALLRLLLKRKSIRKHFFADVDGIAVFDSGKFLRFVNNKKFLPDSYTTFKNKIGLAAGDDYLMDNRQVVLAS